MPDDVVESGNGHSESPPRNTPLVEPVPVDEGEVIIPANEGCAACEEGTCEEHATVTKKELKEALDSRDKALKNRVAKSVKRFRKALKAGNEQELPEPKITPAEVKKKSARNPVIDLFAGMVPRKKK